MSKNRNPGARGQGSGARGQLVDRRISCSVDRSISLLIACIYAAFVRRNGDPVTHGLNGFVAYIFRQNISKHEYSMARYSIIPQIIT